MSLTSNSRKESTESNAAQQMHSTMGLHPELSQLNDKNLENEQLSRRLNTNDTDFTDELENIEATAAESDADGPSQADIDENTRASWGQAPVTDQTVRPTHVEDADWNRSTQE